MVGSKRPCGWSDPLSRVCMITSRVYSAEEHVSLMSHRDIALTFIFPSCIVNSTWNNQISRNMCVDILFPHLFQFCLSRSRPNKLFIFASCMVGERKRQMKTCNVRRVYGFQSTEETKELVIKATSCTLYYLLYLLPSDLCNRKKVEQGRKNYDGGV